MPRVSHKQDQFVTKVLRYFPTRSVQQTSTIIATILGNQNLWKSLEFKRYGFGRRAHMATVTECWRRRWKRCDSYVTAVVARADAEVKPSSSVASPGALPKHIHCKPEQYFSGIVDCICPAGIEYISLHRTGMLLM